jgi:hypothetical protein
MANRYNPITSEEVKRILDLRERNYTNSQIGRIFGRAPSTIINIIKSPEKICQKKVLPTYYEYAIDIINERYRKNYEVLAEKLGVPNVNTLKRWLDFTNKPPVEIFEKMCEVEGITQEQIKAKKNGLDYRVGSE